MTPEQRAAGPERGMFTRTLPDGRVLDVYLSYTNPRLTVSPDERSFTYDDAY